ncbi:MAG: hypothetical protein SynsKO_11240 [Synoicihabitans sp.]
MLTPVNTVPMTKLSPRGWFSRMLLIVACMLAGSLSAQIPDALEGQWSMDDISPALMHVSNKADFSILRASPGRSQWADGFFFMKWERGTRPERGYYSLKTERVWVTTYRWVNSKQERVEYQGTVTQNDEGTVVWEGTAKTTGRPMVSWKFSATKK